jgi:hypothetical protein
LEKEESFIPLLFASERTGYLGDLLVGEHAVTFFFYTLRQRAARHLKRF